MEKGDQAERLGNDKKGAPLAHLVNTADAVKPVGETLRTGEKNPAPNGRGAGCEWLSGTLRLTLRGFFKQPVDKVVAKIRKGLVYIDKDIDWCMSTRTSIGVCRQGHRLVYVDKDIDCLVRKKFFRENGTGGGLLVDAAVFFCLDNVDVQVVYIVLFVLCNDDSAFHFLRKNVLHVVLKVVSVDMQ